MSNFGAVYNQPQPNFKYNISDGIRKSIFLKESRRSTGSTFSLVSEGPATNIIFDNNAGLTFNHNYHYATVTTVTMSGITFSSVSPWICWNPFELSRELIIQDCNFQGIRIYTYYATNATFLRCAFSDYYNYSNYQQGALFQLYQLYRATLPITPEQYV